MRVRRIPVVSCLTVLAALALACDDPIRPEPFGNIQIIILPTGTDVITTGLQLRMVPGQAYPLDSGRLTMTLPGLAVRTYALQLEGLSANCQVTSTNPRQVAVVANQTTVITFTMACTRRVGDLRVVTVTTGADLDPDGYTVTVDGASHPLAVNGSATVAGVGEGSRAVTLNGVVPNCVVAGGTTRTVFITLGALTEAVFNVGCVAFGRVNVTVATTGVSIDPDGFSMRLQAPSVSFSEEVSVDVNESVAFDRVRPADDYHLSLTGVSANCTIAGGSIRAFTLNAGDTVRATFNVSCEPARLLAFARAGDIYSMSSDGSGLTRLTTNPSMDAEPAWSSTGKIAFTTLRHSQDAELYVMNDDGSNATRITTSAGIDNAPAWSPNGQKIVFRSFRDVNSEIYVVNADGTGLVRLTNNHADDREPAWSTTGKIAFVSDRDNPNGEIYVMNADGSNVVRLTQNDSVEASPAWSPDGSMIAFSREVDCNYACTFDLFVMNADGTAAGRLATEWQTYQLNTEPAWSPNGRTIAFTRQYCGYYYYYYCDAPSLWVVDIQGDRLAQLASEATSAAWKP